MSRTPLITLDSVTKRYGSVVAVDHLSCEMEAGEFFALLGPSGCGKTTLMRLIAGFETPDEGRILIDGQDMAQVPPHQRPVNMMFQSYALFPHMSVEKNIAFGLVQAGLSGDKIRTRVDEMLQLVQLKGFEARKPDQLSGGQRQRVALARALARRPKLVLLDEPLGALDRKLREETQFELMRVQRELGTGFVLVTHDQDEAMVMAQRIAVMRAGRIEQIGTPRAIYEEPATRFVAGFIGDVNMLEGEVVESADGLITLRLPGGDDVKAAGVAATGSKAVLVVRPEHMQLGAQGLVARVLDSAYRGDMQMIRLQRANGDVLRLVRFGGDVGPVPPMGSTVHVSFAPQRARVLEP